MRPIVQSLHVRLYHPGESITAQEQAHLWSVSVSTARRELERRVAEGWLDRNVIWEQTQLGRATQGITQPPAHKVVRYSLRKGVQA